MSRHLLGEYIFEYSEKNKSNQPYPVYSVTNSEGFCTEYFSKDVSSVDKSNYKVVPYGYFAYNPSRINVGSIGLQKEQTEVIVSPLYNVFGVSEALDPEYLLYFFKSSYGKHLIKSSTSGSVRSNLKFETLAFFKLNVGSLIVQKNIVKELNSIEKAKETEEKQLALLDELIKSRFIEMFMNKGFPEKTGKELFKFSSGKFLPSERRLNSGIPVYGGNGIAWYTDTTLIPFDTLVIGRVGAYCGNVRLVKGNKWITDNALYISSFKTKNYSLEFLEELMKMCNFHQFADTSAQPKITQTPLENLTYIIPPIELQNEFAEFVKLIDKSKFVVHSRYFLCDILTLFSSTMA